MYFPLQVVFDSEESEEMHHSFTELMLHRSAKENAAVEAVRKREQQLSMIDNFRSAGADIEGLSALQQQQQQLQPSMDAQQQQQQLWPASPLKFSQLYTPVGSPMHRAGTRRGSNLAPSNQKQQWKSSQPSLLSVHSPLTPRRTLVRPAASGGGSVSVNSSPMLSRRNAGPPSAIPARLGCEPSALWKRTPAFAEFGSKSEKGEVWCLRTKEEKDQSSSVQQLVDLLA